MASLQTLAIFLFRLAKATPSQPCFDSALDRAQGLGNVRL